MDANSTLFWDWIEKIFAQYPISGQYITACEKANEGDEDVRAAAYRTFYGLFRTVRNATGNFYDNQSLTRQTAVLVKAVEDDLIALEYHDPNTLQELSEADEGQAYVETWFRQIVEDHLDDIKDQYSRRICRSKVGNGVLQAGGTPKKIIEDFLVRTRKRTAQQGQDGSPGIPSVPLAGQSSSDPPSTENPMYNGTERQTTGRGGEEFLGGGDRVDQFFNWLRVKTMRSRR